MEEEGVIKFSARHEECVLAERRYGAAARELQAWRHILSRVGLVGQDGQRYGGAGFGNMSARVAPPSLAMGRRGFLITGSQTGRLEALSLTDYCLVEQYSTRENRVTSRGSVLPSSESMTHAAIYDLSTHIRFVFHAHAPLIWRQARTLRLPSTSESVSYGTQDMALEVQRLYRSSALSERRILAMGGHEDGVIAFGHTAEQAGRALLATLADALQLTE